MQINPDELSAGRRYFLLISAIVPRPIAWAGTVNSDGSYNLAPFSFFNGMSSTPPIVAIGFAPHDDKQQKDTLRNVLRTGEIGVSIPGVEHTSQVAASADDFPYGVDEFEKSGVTPLSGTVTGAPLVSEAGIGLECTLEDHLPLGDHGSSMILAQVQMIHIDDRLIDNRGTVNPGSLQPLGRLGGGQFSSLGAVFKADDPPV